ncbi:MAG: hypothetical protein WCI03_09265 [bacterium]
MRRSTIWFLLLGLTALAQADTMTLNNGQVVKGRFMGFTDRKFDFKTEDGAAISEYPLNVKSIIPEVPLTVSIELARSTYENVEFRSFGEFVIHLAKDGKPIDERVIMLKKLTINQSPQDTRINKGRGGAPDESVEEPAREWQRSGKWREVDPKNSSVISKGEEVDIEDFLKKGFVNIVHFHYPKALASIREGNYVEALAAKPSNRIVILKIVAADFKVPICEALEIKSLPQFWFYDARGRLVKKLADRFTEGDIDGALKLARRGL